MRNAFADELTKLAGENESIVLLSGDIGNRLFDRYKSLYPERFYNCGVAEANMMSMAAGLALSGLRPVVYTITPFITARCYEQIKVDVAFHCLPVIIVGVGSGLSYAELGVTHHSCDDIALIRNLPDMTIVCPGDSLEVRAALRAAINHNRPVYLRLGKKGEPLVHKDTPYFEIGKGIVLMEGSDICILSTGNMLSVATHVAKELETASFSVGAVSLHTVKPLDVGLLERIFKRYALVVTLEEHNISGGLGSSIAEWIIKNDHDIKKLLPIGIDDTFFKKAGKQMYARSYFNLDKDSIVKKVLEVFKDKRQIIGRP